MSITEFFLGKKANPVSTENQQPSPLNVNVVTHEGRVVGIPQPSGELPVLVETLAPFLRSEELARVVIEYLSDSPESPAHALSAETAQALMEGIGARRRQQQLVNNMKFHQPTRMGRLMDAFRRGQEDSKTIRLIKGNIVSR